MIASPSCAWPLTRMVSLNRISCVFGGRVWVTETNPVDVIFVRAADSAVSVLSLGDIANWNDPAPENDTTLNDNVILAPGNGKKVFTADAGAKL